MKNHITSLTKTCLILIVLPLLLLGSIVSVKAETPASFLNNQCTWTINGNPAPASLIDSVIKTYMTFTQGQALTIQCPTEIASVYVLFDEAPGLYTVSTPDGTQNAGAFGFIHELISLNEPSKTVTLDFNPGRVASVFAYSEGALPQDVQVWERPTTDADLLVLSAHGDDEALYFGPAIVKSIDAGKIVQVAYMTVHTNDRRRSHETLDSLWTLGVRSYPIFGRWPDRQSTSLAHGYTIFPKEDVLAYEIELIRRFRPEVILSHDFNGEYGHGAHMVLSDVLKEAILKSGDANVQPQTAQIYGTFTPLKVYIHMLETRQILLDVYKPIASFDNKSALQVARDAYALHLSQHIWPLQVIDYTFGDVRKFGLYSTLVGDDTGKDLFEHVPLKVIIEPRPLPDPGDDPTPEPVTPGLIAYAIPILGGGLALSIVTSGIILILIRRKKNHIK